MKALKPFEIAFSGINLVEASAGTGKTYNITSLYIRALIEQDISVGSILVVTYTEAATKELKDRLLKRIKDAIITLKTGAVGDDSDQFLKQLLHHVEDRAKAVQKLEKAVRKFDEAAIYTIHSFCYQALQEQAFRSRTMYDAEMIGDDSELVLEAVDDYWRKWVAEFSKDPHKKLLVKLLVEQGYEPETLAKELGSYIGKPYLNILPQADEEVQVQEQLSSFSEQYVQLQQMWQNNRDALFDLLDTGYLSYYTTNKVNKWFGLMDDFLASDTAQLETFTQFYRFEQSRIDDSLNSKAKKENRTPPQHEFFKLVETFKQALEATKQYVVVFKKELLLYLRKELNQKKEERQVLSYDDLLLKLRDALYDKQHGKQLAKKLSGKYPIALVDEFQDTDPSQYDIFRCLYKSDTENLALFMIGDPKQSVYGFRGADVFSYIEARKDAPAKNKFKLVQNFRSTPSLLNGLNAMWGSHSNPFILADIPYKKVRAGRKETDYNLLKEQGKQHPPIRFRLLSDETRQKQNKTTLASIAAKDAADEIYQLIEQGKVGEATLGSEPLKAKDIAVLVRTHKQARLMSHVLQEKGIKSVQYSQESVFKSEEARYVEMFLQAIAEPANESLIKTALSLPITSFTASDLLHIEENEGRWIEILEQFSTWHRQWQERGFAAMFRLVLKQAKISEHLINFSDGERRLTNILHLGELLQKEARHKSEGAHALLKWLATKREEQNGKQNEEQLRLESDRDLVKIVTIHRSKGMEYPIVFCPFLWYGPKYSDGGEPLVYHEEKSAQSILDLRGKSSPNRSEARFKVLQEELAESMRLAYVAMTRAKQGLYITWAYADNSEFSSLGFLFQEPISAGERLHEKLGNQKYKKPDGSMILEAINQLCLKHPKLFATAIPYRKEGSQLSLPGTDNNTALQTKVFGSATPITTGYNISSFSSLTTRSDHDLHLPDYDQFFLDSFEQELPKPDEGKSIFTFPKGPQPGTCMHTIFEEVDFQNPRNLSTIVLRNLTNYDISDRWANLVTKTIKQILNKKLSPETGDLSLSILSEEHRIPELEFYFSTKEAKLSELLSIIRPHGTENSNPDGFSEAGFMKGFIDLTFVHKGKYYLLDYKTNHLGNAPEFYTQKLMKEEMHHHMYDLQYHLYSVALHRFLQQKISNYSYKTHFGGAFYLFIRGMNMQNDAGIYFDRPDEQIIQELNRYLTKEDKHV